MNDNDNILTVELCLRLRDVHGFPQSLSPGDWYYHPDIPDPFLCKDDHEDRRHLIKIPTDFQFLDFVRGQAEEVWPHNGVTLHVESWVGGQKWDAEINDCSDTVIVGITAETIMSALIALLDEIEKHRKVK